MYAKTGTNTTERGSTFPEAAEGALFVGPELAGVGFAPEAWDWPFAIDSLSISKRPSSSIIVVLWCCAFLYLLRGVPYGGRGIKRCHTTKKAFVGRGRTMDDIPLNITNKYKTKKDAG